MVTRAVGMTPNPWRGHPWSGAYALGMHLAVLYESRGRGAHHDVARYLNAQDAHEGTPQCPCERCREGRS